MEESLFTSYYQYKNSQRNEEQMHQTRPVMKGLHDSHKDIPYDRELDGEYAKGVNVMGHMQNNINLAKFQEMLSKLKDQADTRVSKLSGDMERHYKDVTMTMGDALGTPNYDTLSQMISTTFQGTNPFPSTVAGNLAGCHVQFKNSDVVNEGCTPSCAGALRATNDSPTCDHKTYIVESNGKGGHHILNLSDPVKRGNAYIYIPRSKDRKFHAPQFDLKTLEYLEKNGVEGVRFIGYDATNSVLVSVNNEFVPLETMYPKKMKQQMKPRIGSTHPSSASTASRAMDTTDVQERAVSQINSSEGWDMKTLVIFGLIILLVIGWYYFANK